VSSASYKNVLKSTSVIGGASLANILIGMVRIKGVAVLIGPEGVGLMGVFNTIISMVSAIAGMGLGSSGVRQIAAAHGIGDQERVARTFKTLRRTVWLTGALGMGSMVLGGSFFSHVSFGTPAYALSIALLGSTVLLANIASGQSCLLQGTRRIGDLAKVSIIGALNATALSIPCFYFWGLRGIVPSLILTAAAGLATSWWFARRVPISSVPVTWRDSKIEAVELLNFGVPLMFSGLMSTLSAYLINSLLVRRFGLDGVGLWQAAISFSSVLANFVLGAMGTDYFPRLTAVAGDNQRVGEQVNAQTEISLLLAVPGLAATIIFAPLAITLFYSGKFDGAVDILRWSIFGIFGRLLSWPLGYVTLAKGRGKTFLCVETFNNVFYFCAVLLCTQLWGLPGTGIAFVFLYVVVTIMNYMVAHALSHTRWSQSNKWHSFIFGGVLAFLGINSAFVANPWIRLPLNLAILVGLGIYCLHRLSRKSDIPFRRLWSRLSQSR